MLKLFTRDVSASKVYRKLYFLVTEAHRCEQFAQACYAALSLWELNPRPIDRKSNASALCHYVSVAIPIPMGFLRDPWEFPICSLHKMIEVSG